MFAKGEIEWRKRFYPEVIQLLGIQSPKVYPTEFLSISFIHQKP
jgi:hypothetical protein